MVSSTVLYLFLGQILIAFFLFFFIPISSAEPQKITRKSKPIITLSHGQVRGTLEKSQNGGFFAQFVGIPYAQPPVGKLRFARPKAWTNSWNDTVLEADQRTLTRCVQLDENTGDVKGTEDCLKLNIYVPLECCMSENTEKGSRCPLMTFLHPGDFQNSDSGPHTFGPQLFMNHRVVLLTLNYRLGALGFLSADNEDAPGNLGLRDQSLALRWAKREALNFCADPDRITIFGSGSGGESVLLQMLTPFNKNAQLFHRVISQSGSPIMEPKYHRKNRRQDAEKLAQKVGCGKAKDWFQCLRYKVDSATLLSSSLSLENAWVPKVDMEVSDPFIPRLPHEMLQEQKDSQVEAVMLGHNTEEGTLLVAPFLKDPSRFINFTASMPPILFKYNDKKPLQSRLLKLLKNAYIPGGKVNFNNVKHAIRMVSDYAFTGHVGLTADILMRKRADLPTYFYQYGYSATHSLCDKEVYYGWKFSLKLQLHQLGLGYNMRNGYGICRGDELFALFVLGNQAPPMNAGPFSEFDHKNSAKLLKIWTDFATFGNPNEINCTENCLNWPPLTTSKRMIAYMKTSGYIVDTDDVYWQRIKVFNNVHNILHMNGNEDLHLQKIQTLLQSNLGLLWDDNNVESSSKDDL